MNKAVLSRPPKPYGRRRSPSFLGLSLFSLFVLMAVFSGPLSPHNPWQRFEPYTSPGGIHLLGTNDMGHDILSELIAGARVSLLVGFGSALIATGLGLMLGLISGYLKGIADEVIMGFTDVFLMIPRIPFIIILAAFLKPSPWIIALVIGLLWWTSTARVVRSKTLQVREMTFVQSARCLGFSDARIILSDILPNIWRVVLPKFLLTIAAAMISEASLSFLGLGDPTLKSWGMMINYSFLRGGFINEMWWWFIPPGACITLSVLSVVLLGLSLEREEEIRMGID